MKAPQTNQSRAEHAWADFVLLASKAKKACSEETNKVCADLKNNMRLVK
jgi:hypothetical protein